MNTNVKLILVALLVAIFSTLSLRATDPGDDDDSAPVGVGDDDSGDDDPAKGDDDSSKK